MYYTSIDVVFLDDLDKKLLGVVVVSSSSAMRAQGGD
jgi:hypothetical protein